MGEAARAGPGAWSFDNERPSCRSYSGLCTTIFTRSHVAQGSIWRDKLSSASHFSIANCSWYIADVGLRLRLHLTFIPA